MIIQIGFYFEFFFAVSKDGNFKGAKIEWGSGIVGHVALTGRPLVQCHYMFM